MMSHSSLLTSPSPPHSVLSSPTSSGLGRRGVSTAEVGVKHMVVHLGRAVRWHSRVTPPTTPTSALRQNTPVSAGPGDDGHNVWGHIL